MGIPPITPHPQSLTIISDKLYTQSFSMLTTHSNLYLLLGNEEVREGLEHIIDYIEPVQRI